MNGIKNVTKAALVAVSLGSTLAMPLAAHASEAGRRNTTYALGALTAVLAAKQKWVPAAAAAVGTVVAEHNLQAAINQRHRYDGQWNYQNNPSHYQSYQPNYQGSQWNYQGNQPGYQGNYQYNNRVSAAPQITIRNGYQNNTPGGYYNQQDGGYNQQDYSSSQYGNSNDQQGNWSDRSARGHKDKSASHRH